MRNRRDTNQENETARQTARTLGIGDEAQANGRNSLVVVNDRRVQRLVRDKTVDRANTAMERGRAIRIKSECTNNLHGDGREGN
jgi:hypothetical protein